MSFLTPLAFALAALTIPIVILYMLKLRRREVEISSTFLWTRLLRDREANAPWQKLKRNLLLFLQLLLLALLVFALARPFIWTSTIASGSVVILLDASASMNATDVEPSRFEVARASTQKLIDDLAQGGRVTLILVGQQPHVLASATDDKILLREALSKAQPEQAPADWEAAMALAGGAVRSGAADRSTVIVVSDGNLPEGLPAVPGEVRYVPIGTSANNVGIEAMSLRFADGGPQLFARVANYGDADRAVIFSLYIGSDLLSAQLINVAASKNTNVVLDDLPDAPAIYQAKLSLPAADTSAKVDDFDLDNSAWAVYQPASSGRALLISPRNVFLEQILASLPGIESFRLNAGQVLPPDPFDLYVIDGAFTQTLPAADLLIVNPLSSTLFTVGELFTNTKLAQTAVNDPLMQYVDWSKVSVLQAHRVVPPTWARVLVESEGGPLVFAGETGGRRVVVFTFRLQDSDLPLQLAYPILMSNLLGYLAPAQSFSAPDGLRPGDTLTIKRSGGDDVIGITDPSGQIFAASATDAGVVFVDTHRLGIYNVTSNQRIIGAFAVNLFNADESDIRPEKAIRVGASDVISSTLNAQGQMEFWPWIALGAFVLLLIEWWVFHRGATLPAVSGWRGWFVRKKTPL